MKKLIPIAVITISFILATLMAGDCRAQHFGFSSKIFIISFFYVIIYSYLPILIIFGGVYYRKKFDVIFNGKNLLIFTLCVIILSTTSSLFVEIWCGIEENNFRKKVESLGLQSYGKSRISPNQHCGLVYEEGVYSAHD